MVSLTRFNRHKRGTRAPNRHRPATDPRHPLNGKPGTAPTAARRLKLAPKRRAQLKLRGSYLGFVRQLKPRQKAKVKELRATEGYHAATRLAKRIRRG